jgi:hypothetical protein
MPQLQLSANENIWLIDSKNLNASYEHLVTDNPLAENEIQEFRHLIAAITLKIRNALPNLESHNSQKYYRKIQGRMISCEDT